MEEEDDDDWLEDTEKETQPAPAKKSPKKKKKKNKKAKQQQMVKESKQEQEEEEDIDEIIKKCDWNQQLINTWADLEAIKKHVLVLPVREQPNRAYSYWMQSGSIRNTSW